MLTRIRKLNVIYDPYTDDKIGEAPKSSTEELRAYILCITTAHNSRAAASALASLLLKRPA